MKALRHKRWTHGVEEDLENILFIKGSGGFFLPLEIVRKNRLKSKSPEKKPIL